MSIKHFAPGEIIDIHPFGDDFASATSATLIRESHIEVFRFVLVAGQTTPPHTAAGACTIQCLEGEVELTFAGRCEVLKPQTLVYLREDMMHAVKALTNATLLITLLLKRN